MRVLKSLPAKKDFFEVYAKLSKSIALAGIMAQVVSAATEITILYALSFAAVAPIAPGAAPYVAALVAVLGVVLIEGGLRVTTPQAVDAILHRRFAGLHLVMSAAVFAVVVGLGGASGWLSFSNSTTIVDGLTAERFAGERAELEEKQAAGLAAISETWHADSAGIALAYELRIVAAKIAGDASEKAAQTELTNIRKKEARTGESYATQKDAAKAKLEALRAENAAGLALLTDGREGELKEAKNAYKSALAEIQAKNDAALGAIAAEQSGLVASKGGQLGWFTVVCLLVFFSSVTLQRVHAKGSEITEAIDLAQYDVSPPWYDNLGAAIAERINYTLQTAITQFADNTPAPPPPPRPAELYDPTKLANVTVELVLKDAGDRPPLELEAKRRPIGFHTAQDVEVGAANAMRYNVADAGDGGKAKHCENCGLQFMPRVTWQKFCTTQCKDEHHASRHGGNAFDPAAYRKGKKRK